MNRSGDRRLNRAYTPRAWVKHAGLCPGANESGNYHGHTRTSGRGRPRLRTAAWRRAIGTLSERFVSCAETEALGGASMITGQLRLARRAGARHRIDSSALWSAPRGHGPHRWRAIWRRWDVESEAGCTYPKACQRESALEWRMP